MFESYHRSQRFTRTFLDLSDNFSFLFRSIPKGIGTQEFLIPLSFFEKSLREFVLQIFEDFHASISRADAKPSSFKVRSALPHTGSYYKEDDTASPSLPQRACDPGYSKKDLSVRDPCPVIFCLCNLLCKNSHAFSNHRKKVFHHDIMRTLGNLRVEFRIQLRIILPFFSLPLPSLPGSLPAL